MDGVRHVGDTEGDSSTQVSRDRVIIRNKKCKFCLKKLSWMKRHLLNANSSQSLSEQTNKTVQESRYWQQKGPVEAFGRHMKLLDAHLKSKHGLRRPDEMLTSTAKCASLKNFNVNEKLEEWRKYMMDASGSNMTIKNAKNYSHQVAKIFQYYNSSASKNFTFSGILKIGDPNEWVESVLAKDSCDGKLSTSTIAKYLHSLVRFLKWCRASQDLSESLCDELKQLKYTVRNVIKAVNWWQSTRPTSSLLSDYSNIQQIVNLMRKFPSSKYVQEMFQNCMEMPNRKMYIEMRNVLIFCTVAANVPCCNDICNFTVEDFNSAKYENDSFVTTIADHKTTTTLRFTPKLHSVLCTFILNWRSMLTNNDHGPVFISRDGKKCSKSTIVKGYQNAMRAFCEKEKEKYVKISASHLWQFMVSSAWNPQKSEEEQMETASEMPLRVNTANRMHHKVKGIKKAPDAAGNSEQNYSAIEDMSTNLQSDTATLKKKKKKKKRRTEAGHQKYKLWSSSLTDDGDVEEFEPTRIDHIANKQSGQQCDQDDIGSDVCDKVKKLSRKRKKSGRKCSKKQGKTRIERIHKMKNSKIEHENRCGSEIKEKSDSFQESKKGVHIRFDADN